MPTLDKYQSAASNKFPKDHMFGDKKRYECFIQWITFFRRNLHRFAETYLQLNLHLYQKVVLYLLGISDTFCWIAARATAKSFIIAVYTCCMCILYPGCSIIVVSATKGQARLIVGVKIKQELMRMSPTLSNEIESIRESQTESIVAFHNGSSIRVVVANENARGNRCQVAIYEESRMIDKKIVDSVVSPFLSTRQPAFLSNPYYAEIIVPDEPSEVYISSAWFCNHWFWQLALSVATDMFADKTSTLVAMDYSVTLKHGIKTRRLIEKDKRKFDTTTFSIEYENQMLRENTGAFFTRSMLYSRQTLVKAIYPKVNGEKKNKYGVPKQEGEIRIVAVDIAAMEGTANDNTVITCLRAFPERDLTDEENRNRMGYRVQVPYIEHRQGGETVKQVLRMKQIFYSFDADYFVMDAKTIGIPFYDAMARVLYDPENDVEYEPWRCFNLPDLAKRIDNPNAKEVVFGIVGSSQLNSDIATNLRAMILNGKLDLLVNLNEATESLQERIPEYTLSDDGDTQLWFESPYLETALLIEETSELRYEKLPNTGIVRLSEVGGKRKDRYSSLSMGCYFVSLLELDLLNDDDDDDFATYASACVSEFKL